MLIDSEFYFKVRVGNANQDVGCLTYMQSKGVPLRVTLTMTFIVTTLLFVFGSIV